MAADETVPIWVADLRVSVAEIKGRVEQIPDLARALEELRANTVPMQEHLRLMADVDTLMKRDLEARSEWLEMKERVPALWEERAETRGSLRAMRRAGTIVSVVVLALSAFSLLHGLGLNVTLGHP